MASQTISTMIDRALQLRCSHDDILREGWGFEGHGDLTLLGLERK